jgi:hypothetical protein
MSHAVHTFAPVHFPHAGARLSLCTVNPFGQSELEAGPPNHDKGYTGLKTQISGFFAEPGGGVKL